MKKDRKPHSLDVRELPHSNAEECAALVMRAYVSVESVTKLLTMITSRTANRVMEVLPRDIYDMAQSLFVLLRTTIQLAESRALLNVNTSNVMTALLTIQCRRVSTFFACLSTFFKSSIIMQLFFLHNDHSLSIANSKLGIECALILLEPCLLSL